MARLIKINLYSCYGDFDIPRYIQHICYECSDCKHVDTIPQKTCSKCGVVFDGLYDDNGNIIQYF